VGVIKAQLEEVEYPKAEVSNMKDLKLKKL